MPSQRLRRAAVQLSKEVAESRKQRRDAALTWDVPPELDATQSDDPLLERPTDAAAVPVPPFNADGGRAPCSALVSVYRQAFAQTARDHLAAIVAQLLHAEGLSVRCCALAAPAPFGTSLPHNAAAVAQSDVHVC